jgi:hypothetical protein
MNSDFSFCKLFINNYLRDGSLLKPEVDVLVVRRYSEDEESFSNIDLEIRRTQKVLFFGPGL